MSEPPFFTNDNQNDIIINNNSNNNNTNTNDNQQQSSSSSQHIILSTRQSILRANLSAGFSSLSTNASSSSSSSKRNVISALSSSSSSNNKKELMELKSVTVNFIDPTSSKALSSSSQSSSRSVSSSTSNLPPTTTTSSQAKKLFGRALSSNKSSNNNNNNFQESSSSCHNFDLYEKLTTILTQHYDATLNAVPYNNLRSGAPSTIDHLPIKCVLTNTQSREKKSSSSSSSPVVKHHYNNNHGGVGMMGIAPPSSSSSSSGADPAEWHNGPYCHVYIAACDNLDHYRAKVRPALRAFVKQIGADSETEKREKSGGGGVGGGEHSSTSTTNLGTSTHTGGAAGGGETKISGSENRKVAKAVAAAQRDANASGNSSSQYVIVYVPTGGSAGSGSSYGEDVAEGVGALQDKYKAFAKSVRNNIVQKQQASSSESSSLDHGSSAAARADSLEREDGVVGGGEQDEENDDNNSYDANAASAAPPPGPISHSSKNEKELFRKFNVDFPNGRTCILSTLLTETVSSDGYAGTSPLKNQEWNAFLRALGSAIVAGFGQRVKRYDEELRRLDYMRAATTTSDTTSTSASTSSPTSLRHRAEGYYQRFDLSHFFLVKESLAFTYQQMQLHEEALMQYEELEAFVPDSTWADEEEEDGEEVQWGETTRKITIGSTSRRPNSSSTSGYGDEEEKTETSSADLAAAGDTIGFRRRIRAATDVATISHLVVQYLFAREIYLLFLLSRPVEIIERAHSFVKALYKMRIMSSGVKGNVASSMMTAPEDDEKTVKRKMAEAEAWALTTCWDVKCACDNYFTFKSSSALNNNNTSSSEGGGGNNDTKNSTTTTTTAQQRQQQLLVGQERKAACRLSELLEFARLRLIKLGDLELTYDNPIRAADADRPPDMMKPWVAWEDLLRGEGNFDGGGGGMGLPGFGSEEGGVGGEKEDPTKEKKMVQDKMIRRPSNLPPPELGLQNLNICHGSIEKKGASPDDLYSKSGMAPKYLSTWLRGAFSSRESFEKKYLELSGAIIVLNQVAGRRRTAARLQGERAEIHILRGEYGTAGNILLSIVDSCARDSWDRAHYWRVFRLACCQRMTASKGVTEGKTASSGDVGTPLSYLNTLTRCFNPRTAAVAPAKTSELLQRDLEAVVGEESVSHTRLGIAPFLEMELMVEPTKTGRTSHPLGYLRKKVVKHFCSVGDTISIVLSITSHLPRPITLDGLRLFLVTFVDYEGVYRDGNGTIIEDDAFRILRIPAPLQVEPGQNSFKFEWIPMTMGQFLLSTVEVQWKMAKFHYDSALMRRPLQGVDVLQSDPTQTIELNPLFLIPGHVQQARLVFHSGSDFVTGGSVELTCSEGLKVIPPGTDPNNADDVWSDRCTVELDPCQPDSKIVLKTFVKSEAAKGDDLEGFVIQTSNKPLQRGVDGAVQTMEAKVTTSYRHGLYEEEVNKGEEPPSKTMSTLLEAMVTTLDRPALTVDRADAFSFAEDAIMLSVSLHCNTPVPFFIKEWNVDLPPPLSLAKDGDLNHGLFGHAVAEGEELFFGFKCQRLDMPVPIELAEGIEDADDRPILHVVLKDEFGKTFRQVLPLDLVSFFNRLRKEDEYASSNSATAELRCSHDEGFVGEPVTFTYDLELNILSQQKRRSSLQASSSSLDLGSTHSVSNDTFRYSIFSEETDWILGGKVQGVINRSDGNSFSFEFVGIPTRSGILKRFPEISIHHHLDNDSNGFGEIAGSPSANQHLTVHFRHPDSFKSLPYTNHMALAVPSMIEIG